MDISGKIALVTGAGNPREIGTAICRRLAADRFDLFFTYWHTAAEEAGRLQEELRGQGIRCEKLCVDLSEADAPLIILDELQRILGFPDVIVNNAAHSVNDGFEKLDAAALDAHYAVNMRAVFLLSAEYARRFQKQNLTSGRIINFTSGQDLGPMPGELAYAATKGAISAFTRSLAPELAPLGITVNAVNPGPTDSTWMTDEIRDHLVTRFPMGRIGRPDDAARAVSFLASEESGWITGQIINSEGGYIRR